MNKLALSSLLVITAGVSIQSVSAILAEEQVIVDNQNVVGGDFNHPNMYVDLSNHLQPDAIENPEVNYAFRHLFKEPVEAKDDSFGLETLFHEDEDDEDAPEHRAIDFAIESLYQRNADEAHNVAEGDFSNLKVDIDFLGGIEFDLPPVSWKTLIVSHLTSKAAKVTGAVAATALVATGVYKYVRSLQAKEANDVCDECPNAEAVGA